MFSVILTFKGTISFEEFETTMEKHIKEHHNPEFQAAHVQEEHPVAGLF